MRAGVGVCGLSIVEAGGGRSGVLVRVCRVKVWEHPDRMGGISFGPIGVCLVISRIGLEVERS